MEELREVEPENPSPPTPAPSTPAKRGPGRPKGKGRRGRTKSRHSADTAEAKPHTVRELATDLAQTAAKATVGRVPDGDDWNRLLAKIVSYADDGVVAWISAPGPFRDDLEWPTDDVKTFVTPFGNDIAKTGFNRRFGRAIMEKSQYLDAGATAIERGIDLWPYIKAKLRRRPVERPVTQAPPLAQAQVAKPREQRINENRRATPDESEGSVTEAASGIDGLPQRVRIVGDLTNTD